MGEAARSALEKVMELEPAERDRVRAIEETWRLDGYPAAIDRIETFDSTNLRAETYLLLANLALEHGETADGDDAYQRFTANYDRDAPVRHPVLWEHMPKRAALVAHALGDAGQAEAWSDIYAQEVSYFTTPDRVVHAGSLYADIGLSTKAAAIARDAIAHAPAEDPPVSTVMSILGIPARTSRRDIATGQAAGLLCRAGEFDAAFEQVGANPGYGAFAAPGCYAAIDAASRPISIDELERRLGPRSQRPLRTAHALALIHRGEEQEAGRVIARTIDLPPGNPHARRAVENVELLRLAVAICDKPWPAMQATSPASVRCTFWPRRRRIQSICRHANPPDGGRLQQSRNLPGAEQVRGNNQESCLEHPRQARRARPDAGGLEGDRDECDLAASRIAASGGHSTSRRHNRCAGARQHGASWPV